MIVVIPGYIFNECLDPLATEFPRENPFAAAYARRRVGRGHQYIYDITDEEADILFDHVRTFSDALSYGADPETMYMARRIGRWLDRLGR